MTLKDVRKPMKRSMLLPKKKCDSRPPQKIHFEKCQYVSKNLNDIIIHMKEDHKDKDNCEFCCFRGKT